MKRELEADESLIGDLPRFMHKDRREAAIKEAGNSGKVAAMGLLERHGKDGVSRVRAMMLKNAQRVTLYGEIRENVESGREMFTDTWTGCKGIEP